MAIQKGAPQATPDPAWEQVDDAACGCPRYDTGAGILKIHGDKCADKPKPKKAKA